ncbi:MULTISPECIES: thermonuclease family protein [Microvirga]|uniref:thermonuclease family protein n=1 Tax=Microvirga TaxID=186650 RepID=UPI001D000112|nr:thermonuclease family protein [Microvirga lenta]MCB5176236.1 thermonuclease family protein [Microvirga lenta]
MARRGFRPRRSSRSSGLSSLVLALGLAAGAWFLLEPSDRTIEGRAHAVDGDTIRIGDRSLRLEGIDAPEMRQTCTLDGEVYLCGETSRNALIRMILNRDVQCRSSGRDRYRRLLVSCTVDGRDLNARMVEEGWAVSYGREYQAEEAAARSRSAGLWAGRFERPQDWRRQNAPAQ